MLAQLVRLSFHRPIHLTRGQDTMSYSNLRRFGTALLLLLTATAAGAALPEGKVLVIQATAIEGLAAVEGPIDSTFAKRFTVGEGSLSIDRQSLGSLEGVQALFLVEHRVDQAARGGLSRRFTQDVRAVKSGSLRLDLLPTLELEYQLAELEGGKAGLIGEGARLFAEGGPNEPYLVWRIDGLALIDRDAIGLR
jgi:hypothetical protein